MEIRTQVSRRVAAAEKKKDARQRRFTAKKRRGDDDGCCVVVIVVLVQTMNPIFPRIHHVDCPWGCPFGGKSMLETRYPAFSIAAVMMVL